MEQETKRCKSGDACLHPDGPVLPVSEFYQQRTGHYQARCKLCHQQSTKRSYQTQSKSRRKSGDKGEDAVIYRLNARGIYAVRGSLSAHSHVDVVAWGCVRIEVKTSRYYQKAGSWFFNFSPQRGIGIKADLVCLVPFSLDELPIMYSVFPADFPAFFKASSGIIKGRVQLAKDPSHRKAGYNPLTMHDMHEHEDQWDLVNEVRDRISQELQHGMFNPRRVNAPAEVDLPLFSMGAD